MGKTGGNMRFSVLLAAWATSFALSGPVLADSQGDLERCKFVGEINKADEGIAACDRVINDPKVTAQNRAAAFSSRCGWWWFKKEPDRALSDCNEALRTDSSNAAAYLNRGDAYLTKSDFERAFADFNEAIRLDPKNAWAYVERGNLYRNKGDLDHALADLNEAIRLDPGYALAFFVRGDLYRGTGDFPRAMTDMNEAIRLDPNYAPAYFTRGVAYYVIGGRTADAVADFKKAAELNPKDAYAALWRDLAERRNNAPSHLAEAAKQLDMTAWPAPVIRHFLGELNVEQTYGAAFD